MPEYEVMVHYRLEWTATLLVEGRHEVAAESQIEQEGKKLGSYEAFETWVRTYTATPALEEAHFEIDSIGEV